MKTDYKNINSFEVAVVSMIAIGFVILGVFLFATLTPRQQTQVAAAFEMFDLHEQTIATTTAIIENARFVWSIPSEFYNQFYIAFSEVATLPQDDIEFPVIVAKELSRNFVAVVDNLSDQASRGYAEQVDFNNQRSQLAQLPYDGKIMGAMIEISDRISTMAVVERSVPKSLGLHFEYEPPTLSDLKLSFQFIKN